LSGRENYDRRGGRREVNEPKQVTIKAIDVRPYRYAIWCTVGRSTPFANEIVSVTWSEDGEYLWFMLDSHNFHKVSPDDTISVVKVRSSYMSEALLADSDAKTVATLKKRPAPRQPCPHCGQTMPTTYRGGVEGEK